MSSTTASACFLRLILQNTQAMNPCKNRRLKRWSAVETVLFNRANRLYHKKVRWAVKINRSSSTHSSCFSGHKRWTWLIWNRIILDITNMRMALLTRIKRTERSKIRTRRGLLISRICRCYHRWTRVCIRLVRSQSQLRKRKQNMRTQKDPSVSRTKLMKQWCAIQR